MKKNRMVRRTAALYLCALAAVSLQAEAAETREAVKNKKGVVDRWVYRRDGAVYQREYDRNGDGRADFRSLEVRGRLIRKEYDLNYDGKYERVEKPFARGSSGRIKTTNTENDV